MLEMTGAAKGGSPRSGAVHIDIEGARELPLRTSLRRGIAYALQYAVGDPEVYYEQRAAYAGADKRRFSDPNIWAPLEYPVETGRLAGFTWPFSVEEAVFMRTDPNAEFHAVLRSLSGGPVHFAGRPGKERRDILRRPALSDDSLPLPDDVLTPFGDLLEDPYNGRAALKAYNKAEDAYLVFVANLTKDEKLVDAEFSLRELGASGAYVLYDYFAGAARRVNAGEPASIRLGASNIGITSRRR